MKSILKWRLWFVLWSTVQSMYTAWHTHDSLDSVITLWVLRSTLYSAGGNWANALHGWTPEYQILVLYEWMARGCLADVPGMCLWQQQQQSAIIMYSLYAPSSKQVVVHRPPADCVLYTQLLSAIKRLTSTTVRRVSDKNVTLLARDSLYMQSALYAIARPSVRPSHGWFSQKRLKLGSCKCHHKVTLLCLWYKFNPEDLTGPAERGRQTRVWCGKQDC